MAHRIAWITLFAAVTAVFAWNLDAPFVHHHESNGTQYGFMARNILKWGLPPSDASGPTVEDPTRHAYVNRPPGVMLAIAASTSLFGDREASVRLVPLLFGLGALAMFAMLARRLLDGRGPLLAAALLAATPMFAYASVSTVHQSPTLFFMLAMCVCYWKWRDSRNPAWLAALVAAQIAGCWADWPAYYAAGTLFLHDAITRRTLKTAMWLPVVANFALFGSYLMYAGGAREVLLTAAGDRSTLPPIVDYAVREARDMGVYFTAALLLAAAAWWAGFARRRDERAVFIALLALLSFDQIAFSRECFAHDYYQYYWGPSLALAAAAALQRWKRPLAALVAVGIIAQSVCITHNRLTSVGAYQFQFQMARAIETATPADARVLIVVDNLGLYTPYYTDRFMVSWSSVSGHAKNSDTTRPIFTGDAAALRDWAAGHGITHVAWAVPEEVGPAVPQAGDLPRFGVPVDPVLRAWLDPRPTVRVAGFRVTSVSE